MGSRSYGRDCREQLDAGRRPPLAEQNLNAQAEADRRKTVRQRRALLSRPPKRLCF